MFLCRLAVHENIVLETFDAFDVAQDVFHCSLKNLGRRRNSKRESTVEKSPERSDEGRQFGCFKVKRNLPVTGCGVKFAENGGTMQLMNNVLKSRQNVSFALNGSV